MLQNFSSETSQPDTPFQRYAPLRNVNNETHFAQVEHKGYSSPSIIRIIKSRRMRWVDHVARMREKRNAYRLLVGKPEGKRPLGRPRRRWVDSIRMNLGEVG
jgi:hypothetical protein